MTDVKVGWQARREGNDGYVKEVRSDGTEQIFGPMPASTVPSFIVGRRTLIEHMLRQDGAIKKSDTTPGGSGGGGSIPRNEDSGHDLEPWDTPDDPIDYLAKGTPEAESE